jgi:ATP-dependent Lhr-like helicase
VAIAFLLRDDLSAFLDQRPGSQSDGRHLRAGVPGTGLRGAAADVVGYLGTHGASFLAEIARGTRRLPGEVETALWDLVAWGIVTGDGLAGLRRLIQSTPRARARHRRALALATPHSLRRSLPAGRWSLWGAEAGGLTAEERDEIQARQFLRRYGIVFRDLLVRERCAPPWRRLLDVYRRWEAKGEIRGGRFVAGFTGEQFALPEAVESLRTVRRAPDETQEVVVSAADPLNLTGILFPGSRLSPLSGMAIALRNGVPVDSAPHGALLARLRRAAAAGV